MKADQEAKEKSDKALTNESDAANAYRTEEEEAERIQRVAEQLHIGAKSTIFFYT